MSKDQFVRPTGADMDIPRVNIVIPADANLKQLCAAVISAMEREYAEKHKDERM